MRFFEHVFLGGDLLEAAASLNRREPAMRPGDVADEGLVDLGSRLAENQPRLDTAAAQLHRAPQDEMLPRAMRFCREAKRGCQRCGIDRDGDAIGSDGGLRDESRCPTHGGVITSGHDLRQGGEAVAQVG